MVLQLISCRLLLALLILVRYFPTVRFLHRILSAVYLGTTLVLLASDAIARYSQATGAVLDNATGLLRLTQAQFSNLQSLFFTTNGVSHVWLL